MLIVNCHESCRRSLFTIVTALCTASIVVCLATITERRIDVNGYHGNAISNSSRSTIPDEQRLLRTLLRSYDPGIRPVFNVSRNVVVNFSLTLVQIMDMVSAYSTDLDFWDIGKIGESLWGEAWR